MVMLMSPESRVPKDHPIRAIKKLADEALTKLSASFDQMYSQVGRPSIPPERLFKATLLMALYTVRSERQFCEQLDYNLLFRWFLDMNMDEPSFVQTVFTHNRERFIAHDAAGAFFRAVVEQAREAHLLSSEHFTVDGTLIEAAASLKSFKRKDDDDTTPSDDPGNPSVDFHGEKRSNETHESKTDPDAKLARKSDGTTAKLSYSAHALMENRNGLLVDFQLDEADGYAERRMALEMLEQSVPGDRRITVGADRGYNTRSFVADCRSRNITPHVAEKKKYSAVDGRTTGSDGYAISLRIRKRVEEIFGWMKTVGNFRKTRYVGIGNNQLAATMIASAYNLIRMVKLLATA